MCSRFGLPDKKDTRHYDKPSLCKTGILVDYEVFYDKRLQTVTYSSHNTDILTVNNNLSNGDRSETLFIFQRIS